MSKKQHKIDDLRDYHKRAKSLVANCTKPRIIKGAEHWGKTITLPQAFIKELHKKLGEALDLIPEAKVYQIHG